MDVLNRLVINMGYIIKCVFVNSDNDEDVFLDQMYKMIEYDIGINFDCERFYLMEFRNLDSNIIYFDIDNFCTPLELLILVRDLIKHGRMEENIKNKKYLIHFRKFYDNVYLEDKENTLRIEAFLQMHGFIRNPMKIRIFLINKRVELMNRLKHTGDEEELIKLKTEEYRIVCILKAIEKRTIQSS
jgi:hypothetical protein